MLLVVAEDEDWRLRWANTDTAASDSSSSRSALSLGVMVGQAPAAGTEQNLFDGFLYCFTVSDFYLQFDLPSKQFTFTVIYCIVIIIF